MKSEVFEEVFPPTKTKVSLYCNEVAMAIPNGNGFAAMLLLKDAKFDKT